jgi:hypothetical protein
MGYKAISKKKDTGVLSTYVSSVVVAGTTFTQGPISGEINGDQGYFSIEAVGGTNIVVLNLTASSTYIYIDNTGTMRQQTSIPTRQDWSRKIFTMRIAINTTTQKIINFEYLSNPIGNYANSIRDLYKYLIAQGVPFRIGQLVTGRADNLGFNIGAGSLMEFGGSGDINNANITPFNLVSNVTYTLLSRTATVGTFTDLVKSWDNNTVITLLGSTTCVAHRVYRFSSGGVAIQYGQANYANINLARTGSRLEAYNLNPVLEDATFLGWWLLEETATVTEGTTKAEFIEYTIGIQGGTSSALSGCLLKGNNLNDLPNKPLSRDNLGVTALDNENVKKTGTQTIAGLKTFTDDVTSSGDLKLNQNKKVVFDSNNDNFAYIKNISVADGLGRPSNAMVYGSTGGHHFINGEDDGYENVIANGFKTENGTASQFLKANGGIDNAVYLTALALASYAKHDTIQSYTKQQRFVPVQITNAATVSLNFDDNQSCYMTLARASTTINATNFRDGGNYMIAIKQDATGSRTITWNSSYIEFGNDGAPALSTTAGLTDILTFTSDGFQLYFLGIKKGFENYRETV